MAEREGFEPPVPLRAHLISSQARSTGLRHLSALHPACVSFTNSQAYSNSPNQPQARLPGDKSRHTVPRIVTSSPDYGQGRRPKVPADGEGDHAPRGPFTGGRPEVVPRGQGRGVKRSELRHWPGGGHHAARRLRLLPPSQPPFCERRVYLDQQGIPKPPPSPFQQLLFELGKRHERNHLATLGTYADLSQGTEPERERATREAIERRASAIYQPILRAQHPLAGVTCELVGEPDFLVARGDGFVIRDAKLARRVTQTDHPEILLQMGLYGWLFERTFGTPSVCLEVVDGSGGIVAVPYDGGAEALRVLEQILTLRTAESEPYTPVGWTKCQGCAYRERCWRQAESANDVALVQGVDQGLARALRTMGVESVTQLVERFDETALGAFPRPLGNATKRVGTAAREILRNARVLTLGREELFARPIIPESVNCVMFDLEGLPPFLDELDRIYLWGGQVFGESPSEYLEVLMETGGGADRKTWQRFLATATEVFDRYGDLPFVHWHHYEETKLSQYVARYGDSSGVAARVTRNLVDLHAIARESIALPLPSFSLKVVEKYIGFDRTQEEFGGEWSMAKFIEAVETGDEPKRAALLEEIRKYNEEDLAATWTVLQWLKGKARR